MVSQWVSKRATVAGSHSRFVRTPPTLTRAQRPLAVAIVAIVVVLIVLPILQVIVRSLRRNGEFTTANFADLFRPGAAARSILR